MNLCVHCKSQLKPLFLTEFCPNDCDRVGAPSAGGSIGIPRMLRKFPASTHSALLDIAKRCLATHTEYYLIKDGIWSYRESLSKAELHDAEIVLHMDRSGVVSVRKNRHGDCRISSLPDA